MSLAAALVKPHRSQPDADRAELRAKRGDHGRIYVVGGGTTADIVHSTPGSRIVETYLPSRG